MLATNKIHVQKLPVKQDHPSPPPKLISPSSLQMPRFVGPRQVESLSLQRIPTSDIIKWQLDIPWSFTFFRSPGWCEKVEKKWRGNKDCSPCTIKIIKSEAFGSKEICFMPKKKWQNEPIYIYLQCLQYAQIFPIKALNKHRLCLRSAEVWVRPGGPPGCCGAWPRCDTRFITSAPKIFIDLSSIYPYPKSIGNIPKSIGNDMDSVANKLS